MDDNNQKSYFWYSLSIGIFAGILVGFAISSVISAIRSNENHQAVSDLSMVPEQSIHSDYGKAPHFNKIYNQNKKVITSKSLNGKVQVVSFINPYNNSYGPVLTTHLRNLFSSLKKDHLLGTKVVLVSYNMMPRETSMATINQYMTRVAHIKPGQAKDWEFLNGSESTIENIVAAHYGIHYRILNEIQYENYKQKMIKNGQYYYYRSINPVGNEKRINKHIANIDQIMLVSPEGNIEYRITDASNYPNNRIIKNIISLLNLPGMNQHK